MVKKRKKKFMPQEEINEIVKLLEKVAETYTHEFLWEHTVLEWQIKAAAVDMQSTLTRIKTNLPEPPHPRHRRDGESLSDYKIRVDRDFVSAIDTKKSKKV